MEVKTIAVWELQKEKAFKNIYIIDLREEEDYANAHIEGAININSEEIFSQISRFKKTDHLILYCDRGNLSLLVGRALAEMGYYVITLAGGYDAYLEMKKWKKISIDEG